MAFKNYFLIIENCCRLFLWWAFQSQDLDEFKVPKRQKLHASQGPKIFCKGRD